MSESNVHKGGMDIDRMLAQLTDREVDKLLDGRHPVHGHGIEALAAAIERLRSTQGGAHPRVGAELEAVFSHGLAADGSAPPEWAMPTDPGSDRRTGSWRARLRTSTTRALTVLSVPLGTLAGKLMIVMAVAAAGIGGLHGAGVVGVPGLPNRPLVIDSVHAQDRTPAPDDAGNAGRQGANTGDAERERGSVGGVDAIDRSEPVTSGAPPNSGAPVDRPSAGSEQSARANADEPGHSSNATKPERAEHDEDSDEDEESDQDDQSEQDDQSGEGKKSGEGEKSDKDDKSGKDDKAASVKGGQEDAPEEGQ